MNSNVNAIPNHWKLKKLGEVGEIVSGGTPSTKVDKYWNGNISWISPADLSGYVDKHISKGRKSITEIGLKNSSAKLIPKGSVLFSSRAPIGYTVIAATELCTNQGFKSIVPNEFVSSEYLFYYLKASKQKAEKAASGTTFKEISLKAFSQLDIPLPPLPEQHAIVSKIEELFSELENGKQQLQTALQQLKVYRQSLLKAAFEGKLTNMNVKDGELPEGWKVFELRELVDKISDGPFGSNLKSIDYSNEGIRVIRLENIGELEFRDEYKTYVTPEKYETIKKHTVDKGDIIFSSFISESIRTVILPDYIEKAINKADCFLIRPSESKISKKFLVYYFSTKAMHNQLVNQIHGATRPRINTTQLKSSLIPFPSREEQQFIVDELESKLTVCDKIEETIKESLQKSETLRQSILKKAFSGELVKNHAHP